MSTLSFINFIVFMGIILIFYLFIGNINSEEDFPSEKYCNEHIEELSCDELLECYDYCDIESGWITHKNECREGFKARLWKCYGTNK